ncbi:uncharacterized protein HMPREF1541_01343 [Cyphellophora europaea CBS 101466]|uniref:RTA1 domain protein n=1 Tax=Cyphellophora europaea (strain CBS 101466) TaxID=1220924 RepID=W2SEN2_CYPE1|nr:uncharacterized protein HMPREF1541_01343 [Cyphellophora europaea CBS 101466]ETN47152.1 hypothetical protein HMPREF1541_01343 [Cyphellophora europaea CBS 101466]
MGQPTEDNIYGYDASQAAAIVFSVLNSILLFYHSYLCFYRPCRSRYKHRYTIPLFVACVLATAGYSIRVVSVDQPDDVSLYATSSSYVVISPIFVCATLYWQLKYLILLLLPKGPHQRLFGINPLWVGRIFITSDILSFLTQGSGSGIASSGNWEGNQKDIGEGVLIGGLTLQLLTFTVYLIFMFKLVHRVHALPETSFPADVRKVLTGVWIAATFVQIRTVFRLVEFAWGIEGYLFSNEWCLYVFESVPMFVALLALAWFHPVKHLQAKRYFEEEEGIGGGAQEKGRRGGSPGEEVV